MQYIHEENVLLWHWCNNHCSQVNSKCNLNDKQYSLHCINFTEKLDDLSDNIQTETRKSHGIKEIICGRAEAPVLKTNPGYRRMTYTVVTSDAMYRRHLDWNPCFITENIFISEENSLHHIKLYQTQVPIITHHPP